MKRLNVLIVAHEFSPEQGSECSEGWNIVTRLAKYHNITVLYASGSQFQRNSYKDAVDRYMNDIGSLEGLKLVNIDQPRMTNFISSLNKYFVQVSSIGLPILYFLGYNFWQKEVYKKVKKLNEITHFDITHQLTQITFREPGYLWKLGIPFVWGPTGGTSTVPKGFLGLLSWKSQIFEKIRLFANFYQFKFVGRIIQANKRAKLIYSFTKEDALLFEKRAKGIIKLMLDAGTTLNEVLDKPQKEDSSVLKAIWCGQLIERKAPSILLKAIAAGKFETEKIKFLIIGDGPLRESLIKLAEELNLKNIEWIKNVNHNKVFELMKAADFFIHTSYREATSNVIPEALTMGLPVICHDINGMSIAINETCGIKIPLVSIDESVLGFKNAIRQLLSDKQYLIQLQKGATARTPEISWDSMAETIANDYLKIYNENIVNK